MRFNFFDFIKSVNIANKLTMLRIVLTPVFILLISLKIPVVWAMCVFIIAAVTDFLDGHLARSRNMVTPLGQFLDPIADKILVTSALVCFAGLGWIQGWPVALILIRDLIVSAVRLVAVQSEEKVIIPARTSGKVKTAVTMFTVVGIMFIWMLSDFGIISVIDDFIYDAAGLLPPDTTATFVTIDNTAKILSNVGNIFMYICAALTIFSGAQYVWDARYILQEQLVDKE